MESNDELFPAESEHKLVSTKAYAKLAELQNKKDSIEKQFFEFQDKYDFTKDEQYLSMMHDAIVMLDQAEEDIELLQELIMYASNRYERTSGMYGDK